MSVGDEAVDYLVSGSATTVAGDLYDQDMLLAGLQYVGMYFYRVLPRNITEECINIKHGLLLVPGEERIGLRDDVLNTLTARSGFIQSNMSYGEYFYGHKDMPHTVCKGNS